eukprot:7800767-Pyramimonas_sp.AAC.1
MRRHQGDLEQLQVGLHTVIKPLITPLTTSNFRIQLLPIFRGHEAAPRRPRAAAGGARRTAGGAQRGPAGGDAAPGGSGGGPAGRGPERAHRRLPPAGAGLRLAPPGAQ